MHVPRSEESLLEVAKKRGNKRHHHFAENKNHKNYRQYHQSKPCQNPYHPEEDNDSEKEPDRPPRRFAAEKQRHQDP